jgi:hypothetical protein
MRFLAKFLPQQQTVQLVDGMIMSGYICNPCMELTVVLHFCLGTVSFFV